MEHFFPYPTLEDPLMLYVDGQKVDGHSAPHDLLAVRRSIDLSLLGSGWRRASFSMRVDLPVAQLEEMGAADVHVVLAVNCPSTNLRIGVPMVPGARTGSWRADIELEAGALAKKADLHAVVSGRVGGVSHRYLGSTDPWKIWISAPEIPTISGDLPIQWADFTAEDCPQAIDPVFRREAFYVDVTEDPPVVYLNDGVPDLRRLFDYAPGRTPTERALREAHFSSIASSGWMALFNASVGGIADEGDQVDWPAVDWQRKVLSTLLPRIYPDLSPDDALIRVYEDDASREGSRLLQSRASAAITMLLKTTANVRKSLRALEDGS